MIAVFALISSAVQFSPMHGGAKVKVFLRLLAVISLTKQLILERPTKCSNNMPFNRSTDLTPKKKIKCNKKQTNQKYSYTTCWYPLWLYYYFFFFGPLFYYGLDEASRPCRQDLFPLHCSFHGWSFCHYQTFLYFCPTLPLHFWYIFLLKTNFIFFKLTDPGFCHIDHLLLGLLTEEKSCAL